jgi:hypothetical protein
MAHERYATRGVFFIGTRDGKKDLAAVNGLIK